MANAKPFKPQFSQKQTEAWQAIHRPEIDEMLVGGSKGPGKSVFLCYWMFLSADEIARTYVQKIPDYPIPVGWLGRKIGKHFKETTLDTWKRFIPSAYYRLKGDPPDIILYDRVLIRTGGLDSREALEKFNSAEFALIGVDQAEETTRDEVAVLRGSRRLVIDNHHIPAKIVYTANPRDCWLKEDFIDHPAENRIFIAATYRDNPWLPKNYVRILEDSFSHRPDLLLAYRDGDWSGLSGVNQIILQEWITAAKMRSRPAPYTKRVVSVDPARFGNDITAILGLENWAIIAGQGIPYGPSTQVSMQAASMSTVLGDVPIVVEDVGLGGPIADELRDMGKNVLTYNPNGATSRPERYVNLRAEMWSDVGRAFCSGIYDPEASAVVCLPEPDDPALLTIYNSVCEQLAWYTYDFRGPKTMLANKEEMKKLHSNTSPDYGDAYGQGVWHQRYVDPGYYQPVSGVIVPELDAYQQRALLRRDRRRRRDDRTAMSC